VAPAIDPRSRIFFDGLEPVDPGIVSPHDWRPGPDGDPAADIGGRCAVARIP
jgi:hypothetical protein